MKKIGILTAMSGEAVSIVEALPEEIRCNILSVTTGIGKVNAAMGALEMILGQRPDCILSIGCAGSMGPMVPAEILIADRVAYHDVWCGADVGFGRIQGCPQFFEADASLLAAAGEVGGESVRKGLLVTGDQFFLSEEEDARILGLYPGALAADMESAAIAQVCSRYGVPFLSCRIISDSHTSSELQKETYNEFWDSDLSQYVKFVASLVSVISRSSI